MLLKRIDAAIITGFAIIGLSLVFQNIVVFLGSIIVFFVLVLIKHVNENGWYYITNIGFISDITKKIRLGKIKSKFHISPNKIKKRAGAEISVEFFESEQLLKFFQPLLEIKIVDSIKRMVSEYAKGQILESGHAQNPRILGIKSTMYLIITTVTSVPIGILLAITIHLMFIVIVFIPLLAIFSHILNLKSKTSERKTSLIDELPFFTTYASIMESVDISLYSSLTHLVKTPSNLFKIFRQEGMMVKRNVDYLGMGITESLQELAQYHPNKEFQIFLRGYIAIQATRGSGTVSYLQECSKRFFSSLKIRMENYVKQADMMAQSLLIIMVMLPLMVVSSIFMATNETAFILLVVTILVVPFLAIIMIIFIDSKQPKSRDSLNLHKLPILAATVSVVVCMILGLKYWEIAGITSVIWAALNMMLMSKQFREISQTESAMPYFLKDITEYLIVGKDLFFAVKRIHYERKYNKTFDGIVSDITRNMNNGDRFYEAMQNIHVDSWMGRITFFIIGKIHESGGGTSEIMHTLTQFVSDHYESKKNMLDNSKSSLLIAYLGPMIMVMIAGMMSMLSGKLAVDTQLEDLAVSAGFTVTAIDGMFLELTYLLIMLSTITSAVIVSKVSYFTIKHSLHVLITVLMTVISIYMLPMMLDIIEI